MSAREVEPTDPLCPDVGTLAAFGRGELSLSSLEALAGHVSTCPSCSEVLTAVAQDDPLALDLRRHLRGTPPVGRPGRIHPFEPVGPPAVAGDPARSPAAGLPRRLGRYELLEVVGQGAMGVVYRARQPCLNRIVAVKVARFGLLWSSEASARLRTECVAIARLRHENIVRVHEFDEADGVPFFSMEYLPGGTLAALLAVSSLHRREAAALVKSLAEAVHYAHEQHVLHRDLKPANVLLSADGSVKLADFGLAKLADVETGQTGSDAVIGTACYMSPEQAAGRSRDVGTAADVYGLGAILYETLTGRPPFQAETKAETLHLVQHQRPTPPSHICQDICPALEKICLNCLDKDPHRRYSSAKTLAIELGRWLSGEASSEPWVGRFRRSARRFNIGLAALPVALSAAVGGLVAVRSDGQSILPDRAGGERGANFTRPDIEYELDRGQEAAVIGPRGRSGHLLVRHGDQRTKLSVADDGTVTISSWDLALVEVAPDPGNESYRFRVRVRHERGETDGEAGVYFAARAFASPDQGKQNHLFARMTYNDVRAANALALLVPGQVGPRPASNVVTIGLGSAGSQAPGVAWGARAELRSGAAFEPRGVAGDAWRELEVAVTPDGVSGTWNGQHVGESPSTELTAGFGRILADVTSRHPSPAWLGVGPTYPPRGRLGLLVRRGSASFRSAVLAPSRGGR